MFSKKWCSLVIFFILLVASSANAMATELKIYKDLELKHSFLTSSCLNETYLASGLQIKQQTLKVYNIARKDEITYVGYGLEDLLTLALGPEWKKAKMITFKALDGYQQTAMVDAMLKESQDKIGLVACKEEGKSGFTPIEKVKGKTIDLGPFYLVWSGFKKSDAFSEGQNLKWPYQLSEIKVKF